MAENPARPRYRMEYEGKPYGPKFATQAARDEFEAWVIARTGLDASQQSADVLELLAQDFRRQR